MRVLILSPFPIDSITGNAVTLRRLVKHLSGRNVLAYVEAISEKDGPSKLEEAIWRFNPDLVHCYHAYKTGRLVAAMRSVPVPVVVTVSGTDMSQDYDIPDRRMPISEALSTAAAVIAGSPSLHRQLLKRFPKLKSRLHSVPKGVDLGEKGFGLRSVLGLKPSDFIFFLPGGIRPVKNTLFAIRPLAALRPRHRHVHLVVAGPILEEAYGRKFEEAMKTRPWLKYLPSIPHGQMLAAYRACDVTLNTSLAEGLSNAVIEAQWAGRPVLAGDIPGNRDAVQDGVTGVLYSDEADFRTQAERLVTDVAWREEMGRRAAAVARDHYAPEREADAVLEVYRQALNPRKDERREAKDER